MFLPLLQFSALAGAGDFFVFLAPDLFTAAAAAGGGQHVLGFCFCLGLFVWEKEVLCLAFPFVLLFSSTLFHSLLLSL